MTACSRKQVKKEIKSLVSKSMRDIPRKASFYGKGESFILCYGIPLSALTGK